MRGVLRRGSAGGGSVSRPPESGGGESGGGESGGGWPACPVPLPPGDVVQLAHGSGGRLTAQLVGDLFVPLFDDPELARLGDAAIVDLDGVRVALTTDAFVVSPRRFPGGDIGSLAVHGTVNDLAVAGARPVALSVAVVIEEGLPLAELGGVATSMAAAAREAGVRLVTGDTKVVERGAADGVFVVTSGIGVVPEGRDLGPHRVAVGDAVVVTGSVGRHGVAVLSRRPGVAFDTDVTSDSAPLRAVVDAMVGAGEVHVMRDATRGGVATVVCELAAAAGAAVEVDEAAVPVEPGVASACATLGLDPLYVANEGVAVAFVRGADAAAVVAAARAAPHGGAAAVVGRVVDGPPGAHVVTPLGTRRPLLVLTGEQLPRIC